MIIKLTKLLFKFFVLDIEKEEKRIAKSEILYPKNDSRKFFK